MVATPSLVAGLRRAGRSRCHDRRAASRWRPKKPTLRGRPPSGVYVTHSRRVTGYVWLRTSSRPRVFGLTESRIVLAPRAVVCARANANLCAAGCSSVATLARLSFHAVSSTSTAPAAGTVAANVVLPSA